MSNIFEMPSPARHEGVEALTARGVEGGGCGESPAVLDLPFVDLPFIDWRRYWCVNCGGWETFVVVDRFPCGWRGYCRGCEEVKYVLDERTNSEAC